MTSHAGMTSHNLEEEEATHFIVPRSWSGRIYFSFAAIRAALQSNPTHKKLLAPTVQAHKCGAGPLRDEERLHRSKQPCFRLNRKCHSRPKDVHNCTLTGKDDSQADVTPIKRTNMRFAGLPHGRYLPQTGHFAFGNSMTFDSNVAKCLQRFSLTAAVRDQHSFGPSDLALLHPSIRSHSVSRQS